MTAAESLRIPAWSDSLPELAEAASAPDGEVIDVSIVLPCLNEESSVADCVWAIQQTMDGTDLSYEVIVVDNGSSDSSAMRAIGAGASVIHEPAAGYGNACRAGLDAAKGRCLVLGDSDGTYDFTIVPDLIADLDGADLVLGNRLEGEMEPGAMPWMHRRIGTPLLTGVVNLLFGAGVRDVNCGIRAMTHSAYSRLGTVTTGMEFASELVVKALQAEMKVIEVPVTYRRRSGGEAKLRTWSDGWRHLRLVVLSWITRGRNSPASSTQLALAAGAGMTIDLRDTEETDEDRLRL